MDAPTAHVHWERTYRLINSRYPPIDLFEDIADPRDWNLLNQAETKTSARLAETIGNIDLVPFERRVGGHGASYVMAPFTHISTDRAGRFHDGTFGAYYAANSYETALFETIHHTGIFCTATNEENGWIADMRELIGTIDAPLVDIRGDGFNGVMNPTEYTASQAFARNVKAQNGNGIVYPSVRYDTGECFAAFYPDVMSIPVQGRHISYHWDGERVDLIKDLTDNNVYEIEL